MRKSIECYSIKLPLQLCLASLALIVFCLSGCAATTQLYNGASVQYHKHGNFSDPLLDQNKVEDILFLISTGYIQLRNSQQLSIYITCVTDKPMSLSAVSGELVIENETKVIADTSYIDCKSKQPYAHIREEGYQYGSGSFLFFDEGLKELIQEPNLELKIEFQSESKKYNLVLPVKSKVVWVWLT